MHHLIWDVHSINIVNIAINFMIVNEWRLQLPVCCTWRNIYASLLTSLPPVCYFTHSLNGRIVRQCGVHRVASSLGYTPVHIVPQIVARTVATQPISQPYPTNVMTWQRRRSQTNTKQKRESKKEWKQWLWRNPCGDIVDFALNFGDGLVLIGEHLPKFIQFRQIRRV